MVNKYKKFRDINEFYSYLCDKFLFVDNSIIEGLLICEDSDGSYIQIFTKDVELAESAIDSKKICGDRPFSYTWSDDTYRVKFEKILDSFKLQHDS